MPLPKLPPGLFLEGMEHLQSGRPAEAEKLFRDLLNARPSHAAARHFLGAALHAQKKLEDARKEMRRSIELLDSHPQWFENLARTEEALGNHEEASRLRTRLSRRSRRRRENNAAIADEAEVKPQPH
jgi:predicted Zn-dependent protease